MERINKIGPYILVFASLPISLIAWAYGLKNMDTEVAPLSPEQQDAIVFYEKMKDLCPPEKSQLQIEEVLLDNGNVGFNLVCVSEKKSETETL